MIKNFIQASFICLLIICQTSYKPVPSEAPAIKKSREIISGYKAVFTAPPKQVPSFHCVDGPITGNGDIGITVSGPPENQRYWISKNDFWKSGPSFKQCGPSLIGGIDLNIKELREASYNIEQILYEPVINSEFSTKGNTVIINARVLATENLIVLEIKAVRNPVQVQLYLWAKDGYGSKTENGKDGDLNWVTRKFNEDNLLYPTEATIAMRCLDSEKNSFIIEPGKPLTVVTSVVTNHEFDNYSERAKTMIAGVNQREVARLKNAHNSWWHNFWAKSFVEIEDKLIEKYYYSSHYIMACCSRNINFPAGLFGNWITMDRLAWAGDIHLNYNHEAPFWAVYSSNRVELADPYEAPLLEHLQIFKEDARKFLNKKGAYASVGIGPKGLTSRFPDKEGMDNNYKKFGSTNYESLAGQPMFLGQKSNAVFASLNMIMRYRYTYDEAYINKVYPYLYAVAEFWEDYLTFEKGRYVIYNDSFQEVGPWEGKGWEKGYGDFNPIISLGLVKAFFKGMIDINKDLNLSSDKIEKWQHIYSNLSDFPVVEKDGVKHFRACEGGNGSGKDIINQQDRFYIILHGLVLPATNIGLSSDPELLNMVRDELKQWSDTIWTHLPFHTIFNAAARVGLDPDFLMAMAHENLEHTSFPNFFMSALENHSGIPGMINEMMLSGHGDIIRIFPVFPSNQSATYYRLRTIGAFLVSSAIDNGKVKYVVLESEKGRDCNILNPWPGKTVVVLRNGFESKGISGDVLNFKTEPGEKLLLVQEGTDYSKISEF